MAKHTISKKVIESGKKRINITLDISDFDDLLIVAEKQGMEFTTLAGSWVKQRARDEARAALKSGYVPKASRGDDLFSVARRGKR